MSAAERRLAQIAAQVEEGHDARAKHSWAEKHYAEPCESCGARVGEPCHTASGYVTMRHASRRHRVEHRVEWVDARDRWECTCGAAGMRLAALRRHASAANATVRAENAADTTKTVDRGPSVWDRPRDGVVPGVTSRDREHLRGCPVHDSPERLTECNCWPWTDQP